MRPAVTEGLATSFGLSVTIVSCNKSSAVAEMGDRGHNRHGPKIGGCAPFVGAGSHVTQCGGLWPGPRPTFVPSGVLIHPAVWPQQTWAENWDAVPLGGSWIPI